MSDEKPLPSQEKADWGIVDPALDAVKWFGQHLSFGNGPIHCVRLPDHPNASPEHSVLLAIVGNGPKSEANAKRIVELWNGTPTPAREDLAEAVRSARTYLNAYDEVKKGDRSTRLGLIAGTLDDALLASPPSKSEAEIRAEVWEEAARLHRAKYPVKVRIGVRPKPAMWGRSLADEYENRAKALRAGEARTESHDHDGSCGAWCQKPQPPPPKSECPLAFHHYSTGNCWTEAIEADKKKPSGRKGE